MKWTLRREKLKDLKPYEKNPRRLTKHQAEHLQKSLEKFGQCEPVVINDDGTIIGGHQRVRTLKKMGQKEVDVYVPDRALTEKEVQELSIRLNQGAYWDWDALANNFDMDDLLDWGFEEKDLGLDLDTDTHETYKEEHENIKPNTWYKFEHRNPDEKCAIVYDPEHSISLASKVGKQWIEIVLRGDAQILSPTHWMLIPQEPDA